MILYYQKKKLDLEAGESKDELLKAMRNNIIEKTELIGKYKKE